MSTSSSYVVALDRDLPDRPGMVIEIRPVIVDELHLNPGDGPADRADPGLLAVLGEGRNRRRLREPVALENRYAETFSELLMDRRGERGATGHGDAEVGGEPGNVNAVVERLEETPVHGGYAAEEGHAMVEHELEGFPGGEPRLQDEGAAEGDGAVLDDHLAERMEERQNAEEDVGRRGVCLEELGPGPDVLVHVPVSEFCALGLPGGAGGVQDDRGVVVGTFHRLERLRLPGDGGGIELVRGDAGHRCPAADEEELRGPVGVLRHALKADHASRPIGSSELPSKAKYAVASESLRWYAISRALRSTFNGTTTAPALRIPKQIAVRVSRPDTFRVELVIDRSWFGRGPSVAGAPCGS
jgi:hypothetical protein